MLLLLILTHCSTKPPEANAATHAPPELLDYFFLNNYFCIYFYFVSFRPDRPEHVVLMKEAPPLLADKFTSNDLGGDLYPLARGSLRSIRKPSYDVRSINSEGEY